MARTRDKFMQRFRDHGVGRITELLAQLELGDADGDWFKAAGATMHMLKGEAHMLGLASLVDLMALVKARLREGEGSATLQARHARANVELVLEWFEAPLVEDLAAERRLVEHRERLESAPATVLLVDDSMIVRLMLSAQIEQAGFVVEQASNGHDGLERVRVQRPALVLTDINMPGMSGFDLLEQLRELDATLRVVLISGDDSAELRERGRALGADGFLAKATLDRDLIDLITRLVSQGA